MNIGLNLLKFSSPHKIDVHVGRSDSELAYVFVQWVALETHRTEEGDGGVLVVEDVLSIDDPHSWNGSLV
jgi:hypothetical protein